MRFRVYNEDETEFIIVEAENIVELERKFKKVLFIDSIPIKRIERIVNDVLAESGKSIDKQKFESKLEKLINDGLKILNEVEYGRDKYGVYRITFYKDNK